ncbi:hypothetical protein FQN55_006154 [Onygenales sp. PD_40]|nr:hypothetical protein FQN55_006154 [Onygenales sp. PD_40]KAK2800505.1 hypothetical protein FQN51_006074 [Onygenales sp. PD_10]
MVRRRNVKEERNGNLNAESVAGGNETGLKNNTTPTRNDEGGSSSTEKHEIKKAGESSIPSSSPSPSSSSSNWIILAIASGLFAAANGLFAKLTTTTLTTTLSHLLSHHLSLPPSSTTTVEYIVRGAFFTLNLLSNALMWALFTRALTAASSSTKVAITNTTANFLLTAVLGMVVFGEEVRGLWWVGAGAMAGGCVLVGMRDGEGK